MHVHKYNKKHLFGICFLSGIKLDVQRRTWNRSGCPGNGENGIFRVSMERKEERGEASQTRCQQQTIE